MTNFKETLAICTCSMRSDLDLFRILVHSIDRHVETSIRHIVIVPRADMEVFSVFASERREIHAQEDILPFKLFQIPKITQYLSRISSAFRRPIYLDHRLRRVRGWMLQQILKIEISRIIPENAIMHVDSDVRFIKSVTREHAFSENKPLLFRVDKPVEIDSSLGWSDTSASILGIDRRTIASRIYVENCIVWSTKVAREMVARIESVSGKPFYSAMLEFPTLSEYVVYGIFASETTWAREEVTPRAVPLCYSIWHDVDFSDEGRKKIIKGLKSEHIAIALQSTAPVSAECRAAFFDEIESEILAANLDNQYDQFDAEKCDASWRPR